NVSSKQGNRLCRFEIICQKGGYALTAFPPFFSNLFLFSLVESVKEMARVFQFRGSISKQRLKSSH
ncbi:MAG: hypothetical protein K2M10_01830, partial [Muribaculaceae bacterium]|nr:hypothetical protein [Muribaculaceae bacterium]